MPHPRAWRPFILAASYFFYGWVDWRWVLLLIASSVINTVAARVIATTPSPRTRKRALVAAVCFDLGLLCVFKYLGFFVSEVDGALNSIGLGSPLPLVQIVLPLGISFFTFQAISYVVDVYRGETQAASLRRRGDPAGLLPAPGRRPDRARERAPAAAAHAARSARRCSPDRALFLIAGGLVKKTVVADELARNVVDPVFDDPSAHSGARDAARRLAFAAQIYCDFSGYTDMAIGLGAAARLPAARRTSTSPTWRSRLQDFWRRWHITLSRWLRDYLYIPLGGNRQRRGAAYRNLMLTMLLGGLWHGAAGPS